VADIDSDFVCVSNFPTATLDLTVESPKENANLLYEAFTENIPPKGSPVRLTLTIRPEQKTDKPAPGLGPVLPRDRKAPGEQRGNVGTGDGVGGGKPVGS
ncbi:MAG: hypothetical protein N2C12_05435, partial [Planctomycetales bacterium]